MLIKNNIHLMAHINEHIQALDEQIIALIVEQERIRDVDIACSIPVVSVTTAVTALAKIGDYHDFENAEKLASSAGFGTFGVSVCGEKLFRENHKTWLRTSPMDSCPCGKICVKNGQYDVQEIF